MSHQTIIVGLGIMVAIIIGFLAKTQTTEAPTTNPNFGVNTLTQTSDGEKVVLNIKNTLIMAEIARSASARAQGLSGRAVLGPNEGMLFVFPANTRPGFWMKNMNFPIDIVWLGSDGTIVEVNKNLKPDSFPQLFYPPRPIRYVLELPAGSVEQWQIKLGDIIHLNA